MVLQFFLVAQFEGAKGGDPPKKCKFFFYQKFPNNVFYARYCIIIFAALWATTFGFHKKNTAKRNMSSAACASSMYSRICMKMLSFLFVRSWAMPRMLYLSCGIPFPV